VNCTSGVERQQVANVMDSLMQAFQQVTLNGPLANQRLRGILFEVLGCKIHDDRKHHSPAQVMPAAARAMRAAVLGASPSVQEPLFALQVNVPSAFSGKAFEQLRLSGASRLSHEVCQGLDTLQGFVPVRRSFGLTERLRGPTGGRAILHLQPGGWEEVPGDPYAPLVDAMQKPNASRVLVEQLRAKAGLAEDIPTAKSTADRL
jgi:elongation factor 2